MKWYLVTRAESCGWDSEPQGIQYFVAANSEQEARLLMTYKGDMSYGDHVEDVREFPKFPDLARKRKPFVFNPTPDLFIF